MHGREWPYKNVPRKVFAEKYMESLNQSELIDYKLMCFNGKVRCTFTCTDRFNGKGLKVTFYDRDWKRMPFERKYPASPTEIPRPKNYGQMIDMAERLSQGIPFVRVDLYEVEGTVYFGEMTFFPGGGMERFRPIDWDYTLGEWLELPENGEAHTR